MRANDRFHKARRAVSIDARPLVSANCTSPALASVDLTLVDDSSGTYSRFDVKMSPSEARALAEALTRNAGVVDASMEVQRLYADTK